MAEDDGASPLYAECVLPLKGRMIRVLHLEPGEKDDPISMSLRLLDLDEDPHAPYDTVSYVWGDTSLTETVVINEKSVSVTRNLYDALSHIRSKTEMLVVWADAISINQDNVDERTHQVGFMDVVYRECSKVFIWLGLPQVATLTGNPFAYLEHWVDGKHFYDWPGFVRDGDTGLWKWQQNSKCEEVLNDFLQVVRSPWWTRAWTVQECLLPRESVVMFGTWTTTWEWMTRADMMKNSHGDGAQRCCKEAVSAFNPPQLMEVNEWMWHPGRANRYMAVFRGTSPPSEFFEAMLAFSSRNCTDPRDKVYSMLSLATHTAYDGFRPDYRADVATVYTDIFTRMVREARGNFNCFMGGGFGSTETPGLPSWVRDFSKTRPLGIIAIDERRMWYVSLYRASRAEPIQPVWTDARQLHYRGTYADTVKRVGDCMSDAKVPFGRIFSQWLEICKDTLGPCSPAALRKTFSRIICADVCKDLDCGTEFRRAKETDFPEEEIWNRLLAGDMLAPDQRGYGWGVNFGLLGRCFFVTDSGRMGMCPPDTWPGDEVWIMKGVGVPFILRPLGNDGSGSSTRFSFHGDCFLDGIMDGELGTEELSMEQALVIA